MKGHIGIFFGILLSSLLAYYIAVYFKEAVAIELIVINMIVGCFIYLVIAIIKFDGNKDVDE